MAVAYTKQLCTYVNAHTYLHVCVCTHEWVCRGMYYITITSVSETLCSMYLLKHDVLCTLIPTMLYIQLILPESGKVHDSIICTCSELTNELYVPTVK